MTAQGPAPAPMSLPAALVSAATARRLANLVPRLPPVFSTFGFEARLAGRDARIDLGVPIARSAARALAAWCDAHPLEPTPAWQGLRRFAHAWAVRPGLRTWLPFVFLEYDDDPQGGVPSAMPSLFAALDTPLVGAGPELSARSPTLRAAAGALQLLLGRNASVLARQRLHATVAQLPPGARLLHVGVMLARPGQAVRLSVAIPHDEMSRFLLAAGCGSAWRSLRALVPAADGDMRNTIQVDFDIEPPTHGALGITLNPSSADGWRRLLADLVGRRLCTRGKAAAIRAWATAVPLWQSAPSPAEARYFVSHIKLTWSSRQGLAAKVYFGATAQLPAAARQHEVG